MARLFWLARFLLLPGALVAIEACGSSPSNPSPPLTGMWGGDHIALTVADAGSHLEFDCAHGDITGMLTLDAGNQFNIQGTYIREHGGPIRVGEVPDSHPAAYVGSVTGATMMLSVRLTDTNEVIGTFALSRGSAGRVVKCLLPLAGRDGPA
ncbi:MAG TPA: hypothetical protein VGY48_33040 [Vicinamibacterales bacterium]|nr:hypothetical protein [Vicinamibacterales bacterium]